MKKIIPLILCFVLLFSVVPSFAAPSDGSFVGYFGGIPIIYYSNPNSRSVPSSFFAEYSKPNTVLLSNPNPNIRFEGYSLSESGGISGDGTVSILVNGTWNTFLSGNLGNDSKFAFIQSPYGLYPLYSPSGDSVTSHPRANQYSYGYFGDLDSDAPDIIWDFDSYTIPAGYICAIDTMVAGSRDEINSIDLYCDSLAVETFGVQKFFSGQSYFTSNSYEHGAGSPWNNVMWSPKSFSIGKNNRAGTFSFVPSPSDRYIFISNPINTLFASGNKTGNLNGDVHVKINFAENGICWAKLIPIKLTLGYNDSFADLGTSTDPDGKFYDWGARYDEETGELLESGWYETSSDAPFSGSTNVTDFSVPVYGGGNPSTNVDDITDVGGLLQDFNGIFSTGASRLQQIVSSGNGFFQTISSLYSWLPSEFVTLIGAAFTVLLVVACIKLFL